MGRPIGASPDDWYKYTNNSAIRKQLLSQKLRHRTRAAPVRLLGFGGFRSISSRSLPSHCTAHLLWRLLQRQHTTPWCSSRRSPRMTTSFFRTPMQFPMGQRRISSRSHELMKHCFSQALVIRSSRQNHGHLAPRIAPLQQMVNRTTHNAFKSHTLPDHSSIA